MPQDGDEQEQEDLKFIQNLFFTRTNGERVLYTKAIDFCLLRELFQHDTGFSQYECGLIIFTNLGIYIVEDSQFG